MPSFGVAAALVGGGFKPADVVLDNRTLSIGDRRIQLIPVHVRNVRDGGGHDQLTMLINYPAPAHVNGKPAYPSYEASLVIQSAAQADGGVKPDIAADVFKDKIVLVGLAASGMVDVFQTPLGAGSLRGIQLHAAVADSILSNRFLHRAPPLSTVLAVIAVAVLVGLMAAAMPFAIGATTTVVLGVAWTGL